jgi:acyl transferase domain-containing protein/acyl carrier protein
MSEERETSVETPEPLQGIAIVGLAARFPGARDAAELWRNLHAGVESVSFFAPAELAAAGVDPALVADPRYVPAKGSLADAERFDAAFFGFTPREAEAMDPQHRVFLECAWEALEDAGCDPERAAGRIGVWAGSGPSSYLVNHLLPNPQALERLGGFQVMLLNDRDFLATRVSYELDLKGPSAAVATACSTSLVTAHMAAQSLLSGECDLALAGGVSISTPLRTGYLYQDGDVASADGHTRAFDAKAAGAVEGNGCGVVVLKRLADALVDGDRVYAVIRGSAVNNDGAGKVGFTAPSVEGQAEAITESLMMAGVEPATIGYVEGHGSGTPLGDPIEVAALTQAFRAGGAAGVGFCALGSVKTNLGHCNAAAGVAGLIKATLALANRAVPPSLHFETPNPQLGLAESPFYVPTQAVPWQAGETPRRAGVSSFGLGGTNAHLVLEEAPAAEPTDPASRPAQLLVLSARTASALDAAALRLADRLETEPGLDLADVAWTLQVGRKSFEHRRMLVARHALSAVAALRDPQRAVSGRREGAGARPVVFLFPGLGDQRVDMARELYATEPAFRDTIDRCAEKLAPRLGADLREVMFSAGERAAGAPAGGPDLRAMLRRGGAETEEPGEARLRRTLFAQPACFVVEYALARLLISWGIEPQAMIGYSLGEYVAACVAGALSLDDALELVAARARWIEELPGGAMLAIPLPEAEVLPALGEGVSLAATNGPHFCVAAGPSAKIDALASRLTAQGVSTIRLRTTHAFHSAMMEPAVAALTAAARQVAVKPPRIPYLSNVTGTWITADDLADPAYWGRHMRSTVRFAEGIGELLQEPERVFLEVGPGATLGTLIKQHPAAAANRVALPTLRRADEGGSDLDLLLASVGRLWIAGAAIDWPAFHGGERRRKVALPTYPFERQRFWVDPPAQAAPSAAVAATVPLQAPDLADWFWVPSWREAPLAPAEASSAAERWLIFLDSAGLGARIVARLRREGREVYAVEAGNGFEASGDGTFRIDPVRRQDYDTLLQKIGDTSDGTLKVLHLWGLTGGVEPGFAAAQAAGLVSLTLLAQAVFGLPGNRPVRLALVADGLHEVIDGDPVHPGKATVLGPLKVVHQEVTRLACGSVDVVLPAAGSPAEERLIDQLLAEISAPPEPVAALRGRRRWVRGFAPVRLPESGASPLIQEGAYLIAEAVHGPGMRIAEHLLRTLSARVALMMPPQFPERASWETWHTLPEVPPGQDVIGDAVLRLLALEREIGLDNVLIVKADPADAAIVAAAVTAARERFGILQGAFFTGGVASGGLLQLKTPESLHAALDPVAAGAGALLAALDALHAAPGEAPFVVLSSTTTAWAGSLGQLDQAAAGSYLDALAARRAADGRPNAVAVHWDPYQWGGWLVAGAAGGTSGLAAEQVAATLAANGVPEARSAEALGRLLASGLPRLAVVNRDLPGLIAETDSVTADSLLAQMAPVHTGEKGARPAGLPTAYEPPGDELEEQLAALWQDLFGIEPIGRHDSFLELGGHSLLAIQMVTQIRALLEVELPVTALFEAPTVAELGKAVRRARGEEDAADLEALLALVEGLSPEEAAERLAGLGVG